MGRRSGKKEWTGEMERGNEKDERKDGTERRNGKMSRYEGVRMGRKDGREEAMERKAWY